MRRIGLFGGTFNPIHNGHLALAQNAYEQCNLDEVWFIPSGISYMKKGQDIPSGMVRYKMVQEAIQGTEHFQVSDIEISRAGNSYTYETLVKLHSLFPEPLAKDINPTYNLLAAYMNNPGSPTLMFSPFLININSPLIRF